MSYKEVIAQIKVKTSYCDICNEQISGFSHHTCHICKRDICNKHFKLDPNDIDTDYPGTLCESCHEIGLKYFNIKREINIKYDKDCEDLNNQWKQEALNKIKENKGD